ncbi:MAG: bifunctional hydroxymethylpyrimidine kinase/phosphomethylpyrimidine kinase [Acidobacteria bacterium RIFCSPLOWO2_02_FULL_61_28]|nr:MAG: bifunctional hydroxymethylpyrimidine kinase/phosphomethylpyrimidine kinase [Acidobacteria bacterium RIFCSPLOWO2_02_FULL_61_28]
MGGVRARIALTIAGSDPSGGAGIQADLKTFHQFGVYGMSVLTLLTVQNTCRVSAVEMLSAQFVLDQLDAVLEDLPPHAAKTGALGSREVIEAIADRAARFTFPLVVDPVMISKHGAPLLQDDARAVLARRLLPHAFLVTPNVHEALALAGKEFSGPAALPALLSSSLEDAARAIADLGPQAVLIKGGHLVADATDLLYAEGRFHSFPGKRIETPHTHGTGCTYSAAITAGLAKGASLLEAVSAAKQFITRAIETNPGLGHGFGPVNHFTPT